MLSYPRWTAKFQIKPDTWIFIPSRDSVVNGKLIKRIVEDCWSPPSYYYHLRKGGHVLALKKHLKNTHFVHVDIKNFFGSINRSRITRSLKKKIGYQDARYIAIESAVRHPDKIQKTFILPYGFVQSPIIASICLYYSSLGKELGKLNQTSGVVVSVYVDDIVISTTDDRRAANILSNIKAIATKSGFEINALKTQGPAASITAFNINLSNNKLFVEEKRFLKFSAAYNKSRNSSQRKGIKDYVSCINRLQADGLSR